MIHLAPAQVTATTPAADALLTDRVLALLADVERRTARRRHELLATRARPRSLAELPETAEIRAGHWQVSPVPEVLRDRRDRRVDPVDAPGAGAAGVVADFERARTWERVLAGHAAVRGLTGAILHLRPRPLHATEPHVEVDGTPVSAGLFDVTVFAAHDAAALARRGRGPCLCLARLGSHLEARLWRDVLHQLEVQLDLPPGSFRVTVVIDTAPAAFELDEILWELRDHAVGLAADPAGFAASLARHADLVLPDREALESAPFLRAYADRLAHTGARRGARALAPADDGTWVPLPDGDEPPDTAAALLDVPSTPRTAAGLRDAVARPGDALAHAIVAQWVRHEVALDDGSTVTRERVDALAYELRGS